MLSVLDTAVISLSGIEVVEPKLVVADVKSLPRSECKCDDVVVPALLFVCCGIGLSSSVSGSVSCSASSAVSCVVEHGHLPAVACSLHLSALALFLCLDPHDGVAATSSGTAS